MKKETFQFLNQTDVLCDWLWGIYFKLVMGGYLVSHLMMSGTSVVVCLMFNDKFDSDRVLHPFRLV